MRYFQPNQALTVRYIALRPLHQDPLLQRVKNPIIRKISSKLGQKIHEFFKRNISISATIFRQAQRFICKKFASNQTKTSPELWFIYNRFWLDKIQLSQFIATICYFLNNQSRFYFPISASLANSHVDFRLQCRFALFVSLPCA